MMQPEQAIDPVCGMTIRTADALTREYEGEVFYFCSALCAGRFDSDAIAYVAVSRLNIEGWGRTPVPGFLQGDAPAPPKDDVEGEAR